MSITFAQGSRSQLLLKAQADFATTAVGNYTKVRYDTHSLELKKGIVQGAEIRSDRQVQDLRHAQRNSQGDIAVDLCFADHDTLIQSAMFSTWGTDNINIGTTPLYLSVEDGALDIGQYRLFTGMAVSKMMVDLKPNQIVKATFSMVGGAMTQSTSTGGGAPVSPSNNSPFDSFNGSLFDNFEESGAELNNVTSVQFSLDNGVGPTFVVGAPTPPTLEYGRGIVTGTVSVYYNDASFINRFINETESVLMVKMIDPSNNIMQFEFPRVKYNGASVPVANEKSRIITLPFQALRDSATGTTLRVSKV